MWELCGIGESQDYLPAKIAPRAKFFLGGNRQCLCWSQYDSSISTARKSQPGVASALGVCYNNQVSRERYCRQRMRTVF
jgi:hypothetical protein